MRISRSDGTQGIPHPTASSPISKLPVNLAISRFGIDDDITMLADPLFDVPHSRPLTEFVPFGAGVRLPGSMILADESIGTNTAAPPSSRRPHIEVHPLLRIRPSILVVDDEVLYLELIADILGDEYEVLLAANGMAALEIASIKVPHLILLDVMLPGIDGYEVHRRLKADRRTSGIPVIFISGLGEVADETKGLTMGAVDYITKPINCELVRARVKTQIALKLALEKLTQMAETDGLTGVANRSHFDKTLAYECARHLRSGSELSLILLDIDHFKAFNDTYGHVRGDECLREIARALARTVSRATDLVARYGGEEFVVLLPETDLHGAAVLAEKIRKCIRDLELPHRGSRRGYVTASLGVVSGRLLAGYSSFEMVHAADLELYAAKAGGRNRMSFRAIDRFGLTN